MVNARSRSLTVEAAPRYSLLFSPLDLSVPEFHVNSDAENIYYNNDADDPEYSVHQYFHQVVHHQKSSP